MNPSVLIVSVGPGDPCLLNETTRNTILRSAGKLILRTEKHPVSAWLDQKKIPYQSMDDLYESSESFEQLFSQVADAVWREASLFDTVVYAVPDAVTDRSVDYLYVRKPDNGIIRVIPGLSYADFYISSCRGLFPTADLRICPASLFSASVYDPSTPLLVTELNDVLTAGNVKADLLTFLDDECTVYFFETSAVPSPVPLYELDRQKQYSHLSALAVPGFQWNQREKKTLSDLLKIMDTLRSPEGCPWDREQTHESLQPYVIEEAWEVVGSIHDQDPEHLAEELGDLLFQVVFHASIGKSFDEFTMQDVITSICNKMIRRHPHVFAHDHSFSPERWDEIKRNETGSKTLGSSLDDVSPSLPSLRYAEKVIRKLEHFPSLNRHPEEIFASISAVSKHISDPEISGTGQELGRLLFLCAELSQRLGLDCEILLHQTVKNVILAYQAAESVGKHGMKSPDSLTFNDLGVY